MRALKRDKDSSIMSLKKEGQGPFVGVLMGRMARFPMVEVGWRCSEW